jgi:hypothetical protein
MTDKYYNNEKGELVPVRECGCKEDCDCQNEVEELLWDEDTVGLFSKGKDE